MSAQGDGRKAKEYWENIGAYSWITCYGWVMLTMKLMFLTFPS